MSSQTTSVFILQNGRKAVYALLLFGCIGSVLIGLWYPYVKKSVLIRYQEEFPAYLRQASEQWNAVFLDSSLLHYIYQPPAISYLEESEGICRKLDNLNEGNLGLYWLQNDSIRFWAGNTVIPLDVIQQTRSIRLYSPGLDSYLLIPQRLGNRKTGLISLPVQADRFLPEAIPLNYTATPVESSVAVGLSREEPWFYIAAPQGSGLLPTSGYRYAFFYLAILFFCWGGHLFATQLAQDGKWLLAWTAVVVIVVTGSLLSALPAVHQAGAGHFFGAQIDSRFPGPGIPALLLQSFLWLWSAGFFYRYAWNQQKSPSFTATQRYVFATLIYLGIGLLMGGIGWWQKTVILNARYFIGLERLFELQGLSIAVIISLIGLLFGIFLYTYRLTRRVSSFQLPLAHRLILILATSVSCGFIFQLLDLGFPLTGWMLITFTFLVMLDLFVDSNIINLTWISIWMLMFAAFTSSSIYKYTLQKDLNRMTDLAELLSLTDSISWKDDQQLQINFLNDLSDRKLKIPANDLHFTDLDRYEYAIWKDFYPTRQKGDPMQVDYALMQDLQIGAQHKELKFGRLTVLHRAGPSHHVLVQRKLGTYFRPFSLFAFFFLFFLGSLLLFWCIHQWLPVLPEDIAGVFATGQSLSNRIQLFVIGIIIGSSLIIGLVTLRYFRTNFLNKQETEILNAAFSIKKDLEAYLFSDSSAPFTKLPLKQLQQEYQIDFAVYDHSGQMHTNSQPTLFRTLQINRAALEFLRLQLGNIYRTRLPGSKPTQEAVYLPLYNSAGLTGGYVEVVFPNHQYLLEGEIRDFIGSVFSIYVFLILIAGGIAILVSNSITEPISRIGESLRGLQLGSNDPLTYHRNDEIGLLIQEYNQALQKLEAGTEQLKASEREGAWREMAKQVAHEIKNPLTPMKLSVQHLMRAYTADPENVEPLLHRVTQTLTEQIEGLARIATEFSNFAKMPKADNQVQNFTAIIQSVLDLFSARQSQLDFAWKPGYTKALIFADKDQIIRVLNNLITNAVQAIPEDRRGLIRLHLQRQAGNWLLEVRDNGRGIPPAIRDRVFTPNFTTKSSGTGLGLAMSRNIIEQAGGRIYFETEEGKGTSFFVQLPVYEEER